MMAAFADLPRNSDSSRKVFITADEHYGDPKILTYYPRPYADTDAMREDFIKRQNSKVGPDDSVIHVGDFCYGKRKDFIELVEALNGTHYFMEGDHDWSMLAFARWRHKPEALAKRVIVLPMMVELPFDDSVVTICHYAMLRWKNGHFGAPHLFAHSHGTLDHLSTAIDIGVDANNYYPHLLGEAMEKASAKYKKK